jgi:hypothetical protein
MLIISIDKCNRTLKEFFENYPEYSKSLYKKIIDAVEKDINFSKEFIEYGMYLSIPEMSQFNNHIQIQEQLLCALRDPLNCKDSLLEYKKKFSTPLFETKL